MTIAMYCDKFSRKWQCNSNYLITSHNMILFCTFNSLSSTPEKIILSQFYEVLNNINLIKPRSTYCEIFQNFIQASVQVKLGNKKATMG